MVRFSLAPLRRVALPLLGTAAMVLLLAWLMGAFHDRLPPGPPVAVAAPPAEGASVPVRRVRVPQTETAVGTIRAVREAAVASRILGRVDKLLVQRAGQPVQQGELLVELESSDLQAARQQAEAQRLAAATRRDKAQIDFDRSAQLVQQGVAAPDRLDSDRAALRAAAAELEHAEQAVAAATTALGFASIAAPITGIVVDKRVNAGDVVQPGQLICTLYDPTRMQLIATVREELAGRLRIGQQVEVWLDALGERCLGTVAEIVPDAESRTRSFEVKVTGPCHEGVVTGMFGRLRVPIDDRDELQVPATAVVAIGQLDFVLALDADGRAGRRLVRVGRRGDAVVEILSGLAEGELVLADGRR